MAPALWTLLLLVAKWLCQNSVIFSSSGCWPYSIRYSHHALAPEPLFPVPSDALVSVIRSSKLLSGGLPLSRPSMAFSGPALSPASSSGQVAPNDTRRYRWPTFFKFQGDCSVGRYASHAHRGSMRSIMPPSFSKDPPHRHKPTLYLLFFVSSLCSWCLCGEKMKS